MKLTAKQRQVLSKKFEPVKPGTLTHPKKKLIAARAAKVTKEQR